MINIMHDKMYCYMCFMMRNSQFMIFKELKNNEWTSSVVLKSCASCCTLHVSGGFALQRASWPHLISRPILLLSLLSFVHDYWFCLFLFFIFLIRCYKHEFLKDFFLSTGQLQVSERIPLCFYIFYFILNWKLIWVCIKHGYSSVP